MFADPQSRQVDDETRPGPVLRPNTFVPNTTESGVLNRSLSKSLGVGLNKKTTCKDNLSYTRST